jgi:hypothetical protein
MGSLPLLSSLKEGSDRETLYLLIFLSCGTMFSLGLLIRLKIIKLSMELR